MEPALSGRKITALVVDDDGMHRMIHQTLLERLGVETQIVCNGKEAVDVHDWGMRFDLILMDLEMPIMNGIQATKRLREMGIGSTIVGVSTEEEVKKIAFINAGLDDFLEKPLTHNKCLDILHKILSENQG